jgi:hypothetical protein
MSDVAADPKVPVEGLEDEEQVEPALEEGQAGEITPWAHPEDARDGASEAATPDATSPAAVGTTPQLADLSGLGVGNEQPAADLARPSCSQTEHKAAEEDGPGPAEAASGCSAAETPAASGSRREGSSLPPAPAAAVFAEDSLRGGGEEELTAEPHHDAAGLPAVGPADAAALPAGAGAAEGEGCAASRSKARTCQVCTRWLPPSGRSLPDTTSLIASLPTAPRPPPLNRAQAAEQSPPLVAASASKASAAASSAPSLRLTFSAPPKCLQGQVGAAAAACDCRSPCGACGRLGMRSQNAAAQG